MSREVYIELDIGDFSNIILVLNYAVDVWLVSLFPYSNWVFQHSSFVRKPHII